MLLVGNSSAEETKLSNALSGFKEAVQERIRQTRQISVAAWGINETMFSCLNDANGPHKAIVTAFRRLARKTPSVLNFFTEEDHRKAYLQRTFPLHLQK